MIRFFSGLWIFVWHDIGPRQVLDVMDVMRLRTSTETFVRHLDWICGYFNIVNESQALDLARGGVSKGRYAWLTFDDGYKGIARYAAPILHQRGCPFTIFLNSVSFEKKLMMRSRCTWLNNHYPFLPSLGDLPKKSFVWPGSVDVVQAMWNKLNTCREDSLVDLIHCDESDVELIRNLGGGIGNHTRHHWPLSRLPWRVVEAEITSWGVKCSKPTSPWLAIPYGELEHRNEMVGSIIRSNGMVELLGTYGKVDKEPYRRVDLSERRHPWTVTRGWK